MTGKKEFTYNGRNIKVNFDAFTTIINNFNKNAGNLKGNNIYIVKNIENLRESFSSDTYVNIEETLTKLTNNIDKIYEQLMTLNEKIQETKKYYEDLYDKYNNPNATIDEYSARSNDPDFGSSLKVNGNYNIPDTSTLSVGNGVSNEVTSGNKKYTVTADMIFSNNGQSDKLTKLEYNYLVALVAHECGNVPNAGAETFATASTFMNAYESRNDSFQLTMSRNCLVWGSDSVVEHPLISDFTTWTGETHSNMLTTDLSEYMNLNTGNLNMDNPAVVHAVNAVNAILDGNRTCSGAERWTGYGTYQTYSKF